MALRIVDAHTHLWDLDHLSYAWLTAPFSSDGVMGSAEAIAQTYLLDDYLADARGWDVVKTVHIDAGAAPADAVAETCWLQDMAEARGMPNAIVAYAPLGDPGVERTLAAHVESANVRGIRHIANWHPHANKTYNAADPLQSDAWKAGYALLARYGLSFDLQIYPSQMQDAARLAARHPDIPVILNHAGMPVEREGDGVALWRDGMAALGALPNVCTKISGLGIVDHDWTVASVRPFVLGAIDAFGVDRCMFASDFPTDKLFGSFDRHYRAYDEITAKFSDDERAALFAGNAERTYRV